MNPEYGVILDYISGKISMDTALTFMINMYKGIVPNQVIDLIAAISDLKVRKFAYDLGEKYQEDYLLDVLKDKQGV